MRRGDDSNVDAHRALASHANHLAVLHDAKQPDLRREGELADLVEEQRAAVGLLEPSLSPADGAGKRARLVAEQLRVDQLGAIAPQFTRRKGPPPERSSARGSHAP